MAIGDVYRLNVIQGLSGREISNQFYYVETQSSILTTQQISQAIIDTFYTSVWLIDWKFIVTKQVELTFMVCSRVWPTIGIGTTQPFVNEDGTKLADSIPNGSCALISYHSVTPGRFYQRRVYLSGIPDDNVTDSLLHAQTANDIHTMGVRIVNTNVETSLDPPAEWQACSFSKKLSLEIGSTPVSLLLTTTVTRAIRSQRGRNLTSWVA